MKGKLVQIQTLHKYNERIQKGVYRFLKIYLAKGINILNPFLRKSVRSVAVKE